MKSILVSIHVRKNGSTVAKVQTPESMSRREWFAAMNALRRAVPSDEGGFKLSVADTERFWSKVNKTESCWLWTGGKDKDGYGKIRIHGRDTRAHRVSLILAIGGIAPGLFACHRCDNPSCVRPDHLFPGSPTENNRDTVTKGRHAYGQRHGSKTRPDRTSRGSQRYNSKLNEPMVKQIRELGAAGRTQREIAKIFEVDQATIGKVMTRKSWSHV
jgi:hypothetical protein